jgi:hypothetical protein
MTIWEWFEQRSFHCDDFADLAAPSGAAPARTVSLILPARNVADTIGFILDTVGRFSDRSGLICQVVVIDADSPDGTADIARARGAEVYSENELLPGYGPAQGKGDAMWRSLSVARGDIVMFADADTRDFGEHFIYGTLGPLLRDPEIQFSKAAYRRPIHGRGTICRRRRRPGHRADGKAAAELPLSGTCRLRAAAGRGVRRQPGAALVDPVPDRLRGSSWAFSLMCSRSSAWPAWPRWIWAPGRTAISHCWTWAG